MEHNLKSFEAKIVDEGAEAVLSYDGTLVIIPLIDYNSLKKRAEDAEKKVRAREKLAIQTKELNAKLVAQVDDIARRTGRAWYDDHRGAKKGCGRMADAMIIANAVRGMSLAEIQAQHYPYKKDGSKKYGRDKIFDALSVKKPDDLQRIQSLMEDFPEVFSGIDREQVYAWMQKRASKGGKKS